MAFKPHFTLALLIGGALAPAVATAAEPESPARALFIEGRQLAADGKYAAACPKFEESLRLEPGVGTQFNLADCWEHIGRPASAQTLFVGAAATAKAAGQAEREQVLRERAAALEPRLNRLVIETAEADPRLTIKRDDLPLDKESWGKAIAVDPGSYVIVAKAPGKKPWTKTVKVEATSKVVTVEVPELEPAEKKAVEPAEVPKAAPAAAAEKKLPPPASNDPSNDRRRSSPNVKLLMLGGAGVAALGVGTFFAIRYKSANDDAKAICPSSVDCTRKEISDHDSKVDKATTARTWSYIGFGTGALALGSAAALFLLNGSEQPKQATIRALPLVGERGELGASIAGAF
jgi:hypothetical protein